MKKTVEFLEEKLPAEERRDDQEQLVLDVADPFSNAQIFIEKPYYHKSIRTLQFWQGDFYS